MLIRFNRQTVEYYYPVKLCVKVGKLTFYFASEIDQAECMQKILKEQGYRTQLDQYAVINPIGLEVGKKAVVAGKHRRTNVGVAIKMFRGENLKQSKAFAQIQML